MKYLSRMVEETFCHTSKFDWKNDEEAINVTKGWLEFRRQEQVTGKLQVFRGTDGVLLYEGEVRKEPVPITSASGWDGRK